MIITKKALPRRTFLRGMGATLALPFLDGMVPALSAMAATAAKPVRRMTCIYVPNGINMSEWTPKAVGADFAFSPSLTPLEPFRKYLTIMSGLDSDPGESWGRGNGDHARVGGYGAIYGQTISWRTPDSPLPMDNNPRTVFERMFGEGTTAVERLARMRRRRSILDTIPDEIAGLQKTLSSSDRNRVNEYLYSIRDVERRIQMAEQKGAQLDVLIP